MLIHSLISQDRSSSAQHSTDLVDHHLLAPERSTREREHAWALQQPARPFSPSIFVDKNRRDISRSQSIWTDSKMETAGSRQRLRPLLAASAELDRARWWRASISGGQATGAAHRGKPSRHDRSGGEEQPARAHPSHHLQKRRGEGPAVKTASY
eukprot:COSAG01_NODE_489_length_16370_cov_7.973818_5_plen_154_part_00